MNVHTSSDTLTLTAAEVRALSTVLAYLSRDYGDEHPAACVHILNQAYKRTQAYAADEWGKKGANSRSRRKAGVGI